MNKSGYKASKYYNKIKYWYKCNSKGNMHAEDEPAIIFPTGELHWYKHGKKHRENGPAVENLFGILNLNLYHLNGICYSSKKDFLEKQKDKVVNINGVLYLKDGRYIK